MIVLLSVPCFGGEWNLTGSLNQNRQEFQSVLLNDGRVLIAGGFSSGPLSSCEIYDPITGIWTTTDSMYCHRYEFSLTKLPNGKILATGGFNYGVGPSTKIGEIYDPDTETWTTTGELNYFRGEHRAVLLPNEKVLIVGGDSQNNYQGCEIYDGETEIFALTGFCIYQKVKHTLELLDDGRVMAIGGGNSSYEHCEIYDPNTEIWTEIESLNESRYGHTSHLLSNGNVIAIAGRWGNNYNNSCEIYDFATEQWTFTDSLLIGRTCHQSQRLLNDKIIAFSGMGPGAPLSGEIYNPQNGWQNIANFLGCYENSSSEVLQDERVLAIRGNVNEIYTWNYMPFFDSPNPIGGNAWGIGEEVEFSITPSDPDQDSISVRFNWGDGNITQWTELVASGTTLTFSHSWGEEGNYNVRAQVRDQWHLLNPECHNSISDWSNPVIISITGTPVIEIDSNPINFGQVLVGSDSTVSIFISNSGNGTLEGQVSTETPFSIDPENFLISPQGNDKEIFITFSPTSTGFFDKILLIQSNDPENPEIEILLSGEGVDFNSVTDPVLNIASVSAYPNPFNSELTISFSMYEVRPRTLITIYNIKGQVVKAWALDPSTTQVTWRGRDENGNPVSSGIYFYRIKAGDYRPSGKVILLK
ncbi:T9SS type A sorting domain-containing protein [Patescibacteria group bacterium]|nr:T9SS type A sorting domain-containing protein [Patescibacteria group bacterium]